MAVIEHNLDHVGVLELISGYRKLVRACPPGQRPRPVQDAIDTIAAELSGRNYILCDCESGNRRGEAYDDHHNFIFWACDKCSHDKWQKWIEGKL
jgi:hypothetical protein